MYNTFMPRQLAQISFHKYCVTYQSPMDTIVMKSFKAPLKSLVVIVFKERNWRQGHRNYKSILEVTAYIRWRKLTNLVIISDRVIKVA